MRDQLGGQQLAFGRPGPALKWVLGTLFCIWLVFALALNWGGASPHVLLLFEGDSDAILQGEVWRLFTPLLVHQAQGGVGHILVALLGLYFLGQSLEEAWGSRRFSKFLLLTGLTAYLAQFVAALVLPDYFRARLITEPWYGAMPVVDAIAVAWALSFKGRTVQLFFVLPVSSRGLLLMVVGMNVLMVIAGVPNLAGHVALFAGMGAGWFFGGGTPAPSRKLLLKLRLAQLQAEEKRITQQRRERVKKSNLRVIDGGRGDEPSGPDGGWLH